MGTKPFNGLSHTFAKRDGRLPSERFSDFREVGRRTARVIRNRGAAPAYHAFGLCLFPDEIREFFKRYRPSPASIEHLPWIFACAGTGAQVQVYEVIRVNEIARHFGSREDYVGV